VFEVPRASLYRARDPRPTLPPAPRPAPPRALTAAERQDVLDVLHSERFVDVAPKAVFATLLDDDGVYLCSWRTMYRILAAADEVRERRRQLRHPVYTKPELLATGPNQVWSWDTTKGRRAVLNAAYAAHPERFVRKPPEPLAPPTAAWINPPAPSAFTEAPH
jgi:hypothetical protein